MRNKPVTEPLARALAQDRVAVVEYVEETPERTVDRAYARAVWRLRSAAKEAGIKVRLCRIEDEDGLAVVALPVEELEGQMWNSSDSPPARPRRRTRASRPIRRPRRSRRPSRVSRGGPRYQAAPAGSGGGADLIRRPLSNALYRRFTGPPGMSAEAR